MDQMGDDAGMRSMAGIAPVNGDSAPDETVAGYGPDVAFTFDFPTTGHYAIWVQVERHYHVLTVPLALEVIAAPPGPPK
jgi:hypothetical protein